MNKEELKEQKQQFGAERIHRIMTTPFPIKPLSKGTKQYYFNEDGEFVHIPDDPHMFFKCVAINPENATRKFNTFKKKH